MSDNKNTPRVCSYEGSDYQDTFWEKGGRAYEDSVEAIALRRLLPESGKFMLELGAGAGRNTPRYAAFNRVVLVDFSRTQLEQAQKRLGDSQRHVFVAADVYRLPFSLGLFDCATMIRTLHHMVDPTLALRSIKMVLAKNAAFILEFANKRNIKSIIRYYLQKQSWNPFSPEAVEFTELNFNFHPRTIREWLLETEFKIDKQLTVSHFRIDFLKRYVPLKVLTALDSSLQWTGAFAQYSPSVFIKAIMCGDTPKVKEGAFFQCPECWQDLPEEKNDLKCPKCNKVWEYRDGIYDFRVGSP